MNYPKDNTFWHLFGKYNSFCSKILNIFFTIYKEKYAHKYSQYIHQKYKNKQLTNTQKSRILKIKNSSLELVKCFKPINISINDMNKIEEKVLTKKRTLAKNTWYVWCDWLIKYISKPLKKQWVVSKTKLRVFLKQTQPRVIVNQNLSKICMMEEGNLKII